MEDYKLLETIADIAFYAGQKNFYSGDSRADILEFINWAKEFENFHRFTDWDEHSIDYIWAIEEFTESRINAHNSLRI
jgi:hypothetical protein